jgi:Protein of unknown function (DUF2800)
MNALKIRSSSLPMALRCPASTMPPEIRVEGDRAAADLGTAAHDIALRRIQGEYVEVADVAASLRVDPDDLATIVGLAHKCWLAIRDYFPSPQCEVSMCLISPSGLELTGHADLISVVDGEARVADYKTGRVDSDYTQQLCSYGYLALQMHPECDTAFVMVVWVREQRTESARYTRQQLDDWFAQTETTLSDVDLFSPGPHCGYCRRKLECPAFDLMLRKSIELLADGKIPEREEGRGVAVGDLYHAAKLLEKESATARELIRAEVASAGGTLQIGYGKQLQLIDQVQEKISYSASRRIMEDRIHPTAMDEICTIGKGAATAAISDSAPRGKKKIAIEEFMESLRRAGAVTEKTVTRLEERRSEHATAEIAGIYTTE